MAKPKKNSERYLIVSKGTCTMLLRVFDMCYKMGVNDACDVDDSGLVSECINRLNNPGIFGRVNDDTSTEWIYWQLTLRAEIHKDILYKGIYAPFERYINNAGRINKNYFGVAYDVAKYFYIRGLEDWELSHTRDLSIFNSKSKLLLLPNGLVKNWKPADMISEAQMYCFQLIKIHSEWPNKRVTHTDRQITTFMRALALGNIGRYDSIT